MAFTPYKTQLARLAAATHLENTLTEWLSGRERAYAVHWALDEVRELFGAGADLPAVLILQALRCDPDDESGRVSRVTKALDLVTQQMGGDRLPV